MILFSGLNGKYDIDGNVPTYDVHPDGDKFLMVRNIVADETGRNKVILVMNWVEELKLLFGKEK